MTTNQNQTAEPFISGDEAARILCMSYDTLMKKARRREVPSYSPHGEGPGKPRYFLASDLVALRKTWGIPVEN